VSFKCYYASDIHGSELLWRKFLSASKFYGAEVLIMGGDIAGKAVIPIVRREGALFAPEIAGDRAFKEEDLAQLERRIRDRGLYPHEMTVEELDSTHGDPEATGALFLQVMKETLARWLQMAAERLDGTRTRLYVMLGNDDEPALREILAASPAVMDPEDRAIELGEGIQMLSCGMANPTPWHSPREMPEEALLAHLEELVAQLGKPSESVFNLHVPPIRTALDSAPVVSAELTPVISGGSVLMGSAGSEAVRTVIEKYQPLISLHGHIHESRGVAKLGRTVCLNPGSEYGEGVLHGALFELDGKNGLRRFQLTSG
jgi:Icc-related predicted phosphoesterase